MRFIAECGSNFSPLAGEPSLDRALRLVKAAAASGATHAKFQLFTPGDLYREPPPGLEKAALPPSWIVSIYDTCRKEGIEFLCTPFSIGAVNLLNDYVDEWKVASWDITFVPLLEEVAATRKPVILSTAASTKKEIEKALKILRPNGNLSAVTLMHCQSGYPTMPHEANLSRIIDLASISDEVELGLSSHIPDPYINAASVMFMARTIEAHFDLSDKAGLEAVHSLGPDEFATMVKYARLFKGSHVFSDSWTLSEQDKKAREQYRRTGDDWKRPGK